MSELWPKGKAKDMKFGPTMFHVKHMSFLLLVLVLTLPLPALGAENTEFVDVSPQDWFAPYVEVCMEEGLMRGTGDGKFEPQRELTVAEVIVLAARLCGQVMEEEIPAVPLGEQLEPDDSLVQLWPFFVDQDMSPEEESDPAAIILALGNNERSAISKFLNQLTQDPSPYRWYLDEAYYLWGRQISEMEELAQRLKFQAGTAANTPARRRDFGELLGRLIPSPVATRMPEDITVLDSQGSRVLITAGVMEGTGEGYALDKSLTRAECAALLARMMRPELRKGPTVEVRAPEELVKVEVQHGSFGHTESRYTIDLEGKALTCWYSGYFRNEEDREETAFLTEEALEGFWRSQAPEALLGWGEIYYNLNIFDGHQWGVALTFSNGEVREISGSNAYPEGWDLVYDALLALTGKNVMDVRSNWLNDLK